MSKTLQALVVDDSRVIRRVAVDILKEMGFHTVEAEHGKAAVEFCRTTVPDLVLLDWNMPEMDGLSCLRALRKAKLSPRPFIVMCTTENSMSKIREALESGADEYIMKPYDRHVLMDKLIQLGMAELT
jgi:two-component system chemotaxis response regulator CheY